MGFLTKIFNFNKSYYYNGLIAELKADKERLIKENDELKSKINMLEVKLYDFTFKENKVNINKTTLSTTELKVYNKIKELGLSNKDKIMKELKLNDNSFKVYCHRIKKKGFEF